MTSPLAQVCLYGTREVGFAYLATGPELSSPILAQGGWSDGEEPRPSGLFRTLTEVVAEAKAALRALGHVRGELVVCFPGGERCARTRVDVFESVATMSLEPAPVVVLTPDTIENAARAVATRGVFSGAPSSRAPEDVAPLGRTSTGKIIPQVPTHLGALERAASEAGAPFDEARLPAIRAAQAAARAHFDAYASGFTLADHRDAARLLRGGPREPDRFLRYAKNGLATMHERVADAVVAKNRREWGS